MASPPPVSPTVWFVVPQQMESSDCGSHSALIIPDLTCHALCASGETARVVRDAHRATLFLLIVSIRHKGLRVLFEEGGTAGVKPQHLRKLRLQLVALHTATTIDDMNIPGWRLHQLKGSRASTWSITVDKNWRLTFEFLDGNVYLLDYEDYH
jgi:proteic killer suppression protein